MKRKKNPQSSPKNELETSLKMVLLPPLADLVLKYLGLLLVEKIQLADSIFSLICLNQNEIWWSSWSGWKRWRRLPDEEKEENTNLWREYCVLHSGWKSDFNFEERDPCFDTYNCKWRLEGSHGTITSPNGNTISFKTESNEILQAFQTSARDIIFAEARRDKTALILHKKGKVAEFAGSWSNWGCLDNQVVYCENEQGIPILCIIDLLTKKRTVYNMDQDFIFSEDEKYSVLCAKNTIFVAIECTVYKLVLL